MRNILPFLVLAACGSSRSESAPPWGGSATTTPGPQVAVAPAPAGEACPVTFACYGACEPLTEDCIAACDARATAAATAASHAIITCMSASGCADEACLTTRCASELAACSADGRAAAATATGTATAKPAADTFGFASSAVTFDDGWTATAEADWVRVSKGDVEVFLYYGLPYDASMFSGTGLADRDYFWDTYVARQFETGSKQYPAGVSYPPPAYVEGWGTDRATGARRFLGMYLAIEPNTGLVALASTPDEETFRAMFPRPYEMGQSDLYKMSAYNRFPLADGDVVGTWQEGGGGTMNWYDANTGAYAGATFASLAAVFTFAADGTYTSVHDGASGAVGAMNSFHQEYDGEYAIAPWSLTASKRFDGKTVEFSAYLEVVRGGRLLVLDDHNGSSYRMVRTKR